MSSEQSSSISSSPKTMFDTTRISYNLSESISTSSSLSSTVDEVISSESTTYLPTESSSLEPELLPPDRNLSVAYTVSEAIVSLLAVFGNALVVYIFCKNRSLRRYRNYYIVALAIADFLVGLLGIPFAILASVGLPRNLYGCLFTVSILIVLCTVSILCLVAVSIDRYWATTNPFAYYRNMTTTTAVSIILFCWVAGAIIGFLPMFGWYNREGWEKYPPEYCFFTDVMSYSYLVFLYFATIVFPALLMIGFYGYIYHVVLIKIRQKGTLAPQHLRRFSEQSRTGSLSCENRSATQVLRIMVSEKRREAKAAKKLGIIVLFFMLCWMPLYTINCIQAFYPIHVPIEILNFTIILSHANSALNPFLYAYHLKEFRLAMKNALVALCGKLFCGLCHAHAEKENPLGPMSRSLTMPSLGHVTTIPNPTSGGKVSIKFRKIGRPDEPRSVQISPPTRNNINAMIPPATLTAAATASRGNLLFTAGGHDKSLTSLSMDSDSSSKLLEISLQVTPTLPCGLSKNSPKPPHQQSNGSSKMDKCNNGPLYNNHFTLAPPQTPPTTPSAHNVPIEGDNNCNKTGQESLPSIPQKRIEDEGNNSPSSALNCQQDENETDGEIGNAENIVDSTTTSHSSSESIINNNKNNFPPGKDSLSPAEDGKECRNSSQVGKAATKKNSQETKKKENDDADDDDQDQDQDSGQLSRNHVLLTNSNEQSSFESSHGDSNAKEDPSSPILKQKQMLSLEKHQNCFDNKSTSVTQASNGISLEG